MNLTEHYKLYLMEMLFLSEEERRIKKATPKEAAVLRQLKGTPERKEKFDGTNVLTPRTGNELNWLTGRQRDRALQMAADGRVPQATQHDRKRPQAKPGVGLRNNLLFRTEPNPMDAVSMDALSPTVSSRELNLPTAAKEYEKSKKTKSPKEEEIIARASKALGVELKPEDYDGLEIDHPNFVAFVRGRFNAKNPNLR